MNFGTARSRWCALFYTLGSLLLAATASADALPEHASRDWPSYGGGYREFHYSALDQIAVDNVRRLGLAWSYDLPPAVTPFTAPIAIDGTLYFSYGLGVVHAMDAATGELKWKHDSAVHASDGRRKMRIGWGMRGIAHLDGRLYTGTVDGRLIALNASSGEVEWSVDTTDPNDQLYISGPPWVFKNTVVIGNGGAERNRRRAPDQFRKCRLPSGSDTCERTFTGKFTDMVFAQNAMVIFVVVAKLFAHHAGAALHQSNDFYHFRSPYC